MCVCVCVCVCVFMQYTCGIMVCKVYMSHLLSIAGVTSFNLEIAKSFTAVFVLPQIRLVFYVVSCDFYFTKTANIADFKGPVCNISGDLFAELKCHQILHTGPLTDIICLNLKLFTCETRLSFGILDLY